MSLAESITFSTLENLSRTAGDSFFVFDREVFRRNIRRFHSAVSAHYSNAQLAYALKANYMPKLLEVLAEEGMLAEAASRMEYDIARTQVPAANIIFNGPLKRKEDLEHALRAGSRVNLDSLLEIRALETLSPSIGKVEVGIRVGFHLEKSGNSRFGFSSESAEFEEAISRLRKIDGVRITGLHAHFSTRAKSPDSFQERAQRLVGVARRFQKSLQLSDLNIGGGFFGDMPKDLRARFGEPIPTFEDYAVAITGPLKEAYPDMSIRLIFEPGVSVVASSMAFAARILDIRPGHELERVLCDSSTTIINPTGSAILAQPKYVTASNPIRANRKFDVVGTTCMEHDVLCTEQEASIAIGDWIVFENRGAYSNVCKGPFIVPSPPIISIDGRVLKRRENACDSLATYAESFEPQ